MSWKHCQTPYTLSHLSTCLGLPQGRNNRAILLKMAADTRISTNLGCWSQVPASVKASSAQALILIDATRTPRPRPQPNDPTKKAGRFQLPSELRNQIYHYVAAAPNNIEIHAGLYCNARTMTLPSAAIAFTNELFYSHLPLFRVNRRIRAEYLAEVRTIQPRFVHLKYTLDLTQPDVLASENKLEDMAQKLAHLDSNVAYALRIAFQLDGETFVMRVDRRQMQVPLEQS